MSRDGVPVYVRRREAPGTTIRRPQHVYETDLRTTPGGCPLHSDATRKVVCQVVSNVRESSIWCDDCRGSHEYTQLRKSYQEMGVSFPQMWQDTDTINLSTGRVETDPRKFAQHLAVQSEIMSERLNMKVDYQPCDMTDRASLGVTDEGLDATHDHRVAIGQKDSRGRFVFPVT